MGDTEYQEREEQVCETGYEKQCETRTQRLCQPTTRQECTTNYVKECSTIYKNVCVQKFRTDKPLWSPGPRTSSLLRRGRGGGRSCNDDDGPLLQLCLRWRRRQPRRGSGFTGRRHRLLQLPQP